MQLYELLDILHKLPESEVTFEVQEPEFTHSLKLEDVVIGGFIDGEQKIRITFKPYGANVKWNQPLGQSQQFGYRQDKIGDLKA